tara:strand:- start:107 stop:544 length:438 start_codon:yes stop_codon:yes gene_type:complete
MQNTKQRPYIDDLQASLDVTRMMQECLEKRIELGMNHMKDVSEYEQNEIKILLIRTRGEIDTLKKVISEKEDYFKKYIEEYEKDVEEMNKNYDSVIQTAHAKKEGNKLLKHTMEDAKWDVINSTEQYKVAIYKRIKKILSDKPNV